MFKKTMVTAWAVGAVLTAHAALVINEVCYDNSTVPDETGDTSSDWIEIYNSGPGGVNLLNYGVGDANPYEEAKGVRLPNYTLAPGGCLLVFANPDLPEYTVWTNAPDLALVAANTPWRYLAADAAPPAAWKTAAFSDAGWASGIAPIGYNDPKLDLDCATVLDDGGDPNNRRVTAYFRTSFPVVNPAVITGLVVRARVNDGMAVYLNGVEVLRQNLPAGEIGHDTLASIGVPSTQWSTNALPSAGLVAGVNLLAVEVHQASVSSVDLIMDVSLAGLVDEQVPIVHGQFGLSKDGENAHLFDNWLVRIHKYDSPGYEIGENKSLGLSVDGVTGARKVFDRPTPGLPNATWQQRYSETLATQVPMFSVPPGMYAAGQQVILSTPTPGYRIFYTVDGTDPRESASFVWSGFAVTVTNRADAAAGLAWNRTNPVEISNAVPHAAWLPPIGAVGQAVVLRAVAVSSDGQYCSPEASGSYFIAPAGTDRTLPVFSLITNPENLYGFVEGLFVPGKTYADSPVGYGENRWGKPYANYHNENEDQTWERPVHLELFEPAEDTAAVSLVMGLAMHGGGSRAIPQKSLYLMARLGDYGTDLITYPLFPDEAATQYKRFLLRNSGNDWYGPDVPGTATMMKDAVFHEIVRGLRMSVMAGRPAVAFVNGEYWGLHNLRESLDKHYLATRYGLNPDNVDILMHEEDSLDNDKVHIERIDGDTNSDEEYEAMIDWIQLHPLDLEANYQEVQGWIDVDNYADYIIAETFFGNTDWPINNCDFWRAHTNQVAECGEYGDTRWRWMLYDLDLAGEEGPAFDMLSYLSSSKMTGGREPGFLINQLWENMGFRNNFVLRYADLLNTTFRPERTAALIRQRADAIEPEIERHFRRWGRSTTVAEWRAAVETALVEYCATRHAVTWGHLDAHFVLGGTGMLTVANADAAGTGGYLVVNGVTIDAGTDGVTNRAEWTGTYFRSLPVPVTAAADPGYVFDGWVGTTITNPVRSVYVGAAPVRLVARFRPAGDPPYTPAGYEQWQLVNYDEQAILSGETASPEAPSGQAGLSNFELYAFGMHLGDGLTDEQRRARASVTIAARDPGLWVGYHRLSDAFTDVDYALRVADSMAAPVAWRPAETGPDLTADVVTNVLDAATWQLEIRLPPGLPAQYFTLSVSPAGVSP